MPPLNNEENNRINEYTTAKIKDDEEDQLNNEGSGIDNRFPEEDNDVNGLDINTTRTYANDVDNNDNNESDGQGCVYEVWILINEKPSRSKYLNLKALQSWFVYTIYSYLRILFLRREFYLTYIIISHS